MSKILINNTASPVVITDVGQTVPASSTLTIQPQDYWLYAASSDVITLISDLAVGPTTSTLTVNDGSFDLSIADGTRLIQHIFPNPVRLQGDTDGTSIGNVGDKLKVTTSDEKNSFDTSMGVTIGTTETTLTIPAGTLKFSIQAVNPRFATLTLAGAVGGTAADLTSYKLYPGSSFNERLGGGGDLTIYIKSSKINTAVQLILWT